MKTAVELFIEQLEKQGDSWENVSIGRIQISIKVEDYLKLKEQAKEMEKEQKGYSKEDLFKILLDFVAFPHHDMEPRGSIIERYLNELSKKKLNN
jgi:hypothetical protein